MLAHLLPISELKYPHHLTREHNLVEAPIKHLLNPGKN